MTPRKTQQGATANARKALVARGARVASSSRTTKPSNVKAKPKARKAASASKAAAGLSWRWWLLPVIVSATVAVFIGAYYPVAKVQYRETRNRDLLQAELTTVQARNGRLRTQVARLKTPEGVEDYARTQLGMVKQGEHVVVVLDGTKPQAADIATIGAPPRLDSDEATVAPAGPWNAFLDSVFGLQ
jgi:cell division protein FtsB